MASVDERRELASANILLFTNSDQQEQKGNVCGGIESVCAEFGAGDARREGTTLPIEIDEDQLILENGKKCIVMW